jgi:hypothetical protein
MSEFRGEDGEAVRFVVYILIGFVVYILFLFFERAKRMKGPGGRYSNVSRLTLSFSLSPLHEDGFSLSKDS